VSFLARDNQAIAPCIPSLKSRSRRFDDCDGLVLKTYCGRTCPGAESPYEALAGEIEMLGKLGGRDLLGELGERHRDS
jgi:hypothetical protein